MTAIAQKIQAQDEAAGQFKRVTKSESLQHATTAGARKP